VMDTLRRGRWIQTGGVGGGRWQTTLYGSPTTLT
jgi:hypothetical protein